MRLLLSLCLVGFAAAACPSGSVYDSTFNRCYKFTANRVAFFLAEQNCVSLGGHLASIQNGFENALVAETASSTFGSTADYWLGASQLAAANWTWNDNTPFTYNNWAAGQPTSGSGQCLAASNPSTTWNSTACGAAKPYVCVIPGDSTPPTPKPCPTQGPHVGYCSSGWTYYDRTDSCYKVLLTDNFENAENTCQASYAHLASIHSAAENEWVGNLAATGMTLDWDGMMWIGMHKVNNQWTYTDGTPVDYYNWSPGNPDNNKGDENCVQLLSDELSGKGHNSGFHLTWNDIKCTDTMRAMACKRAALH